MADGFKVHLLRHVNQVDFLSKITRRSTNPVHAATPLLNRTRGGREMNAMIRTVTHFAVFIVSLAVAACGGGGHGVPPATGKSWGTAQLIETDNAGDALLPRIAFDGNGNAIAVWAQSDGMRYNIMANRYAAGSGWGTTQPIETNDGEANHLLIESTPPQVAFDASGNAIVVWSQSDGTRWNIWSNRYIAGSGWGTAQLIETDNTGDASSPKIAFDITGNAIAVWFQLVELPFPLMGQRYSIRANRYTAGAGWGTAVPVDIGLSSVDRSGSVNIAIGANGDAIAVWQQNDGSNFNIWANHYTPGSGWGVPGLIETSNLGNAFSPSIVIDNAGNAIAVWIQWDGVNNSAWANRYIAGSGWNTAQLIEMDNAGWVYNPQIALDPGGDVIAVWAQSDGMRNNIWANRYTAGSGWSTAQLIESDNSGDASAPHIAFDPGANAIAVWQQSDGMRNNIWANRYTAGSGWGTAQLIESDNSGNASAPHIAFDQDSNAIAVWAQSDGSTFNIWANHYR